MNIGEICTREVVTADRASNLQQAAALMRQHHVGTLVATTDSPDGVQAVGIVTDRDLVIEAMARGLSATETQIGRLVDDKIATVPASGNVDDAIATMKEQGVRRLLVSGEGGHLFGIVSLDDVLDALAHEMSEVAHAVRGGIERETAERRPLPSVEIRTVRVPPFPIA